MSKLPNPNSGKRYDRVSNNIKGEPEFGYRNEGTSDEEVVHIPSGHSNQTYWKPEMVMDPTGCSHEFEITDIGKREVECIHCHLPTSFNAGINYQEIDGKSTILIKNNAYPILNK